MLIVNYTVRNAGIMMWNMYFNNMDRIDVFLPIQDIFEFGTPKPRPDNVTKLIIYLLPLFYYNYSTKNPVLMTQQTQDISKTFYNGFEMVLYLK